MDVCETKCLGLTTITYPVPSALHTPRQIRPCPNTRLLVCMRCRIPLWQLTAGDILECCLEVSNPGSASEPLKFQALLHNYLRLPEGTLPSDVAIDDALTGLTYKDKTQNYKESKEERKSVNFVDEVDRIYSNAPSSFVAKYGTSQQGVKIETTNLGE